MHIPSRYVVGYYAHESSGAGVTVVRQRDAHAWAECWVEGVGWIVLDATPGDGRPDRRAAPIPNSVRFAEWLESEVAHFRLWLTGGGLWKGAGAAAVAAIVLLSVQALLALRKSRNASRPFQYTLSSAELAAYYREFETLCRKWGLVCPVGLAWQDYLSRYKAAGAEAVVKRVRKPPMEAIEAFLRIYNAARFGGSAAPDEIQRLLKRIEKGDA